MELTGRRKLVWEEIEAWEKSFFIDENKNSYYSLEHTFNEAIQSWRPNVQEKILKTLDSIIFHTHSIAQNSQYDKKTKAKILDFGRIFDGSIHEISDMKVLTIDQLRFIANQHLAKQRLVSFAQGGFSGLGGLLAVSLDLPLMLTINLRSIQLTAMTYGYDLNNPYELMLALKVFHVATLPKTLQKEGWHHLLMELNQYEDKWIFFDENDNYKSTVWLQQPIKQMGKGFVLFLLRNKLFQGIPLLGMTIGAGTNYFLAKQVSDIAHHFYQKRFLLEDN